MASLPVLGGLIILVGCNGLLPVAGRLLNGGRSWQFVVLPFGAGDRRGVANHIGRRGAVEAKARGDLRHRLPRLVERHRLFRQLRTKPAMNPPQWEWCEDWRWTEM